jgi:hypothetical protein
MCCLLSYTGMRAPRAADYWANEITNVGSRGSLQAVLHWCLRMVRLRRTKHSPHTRHETRINTKYLPGF